MKELKTNCGASPDSMNDKGPNSRRRRLLQAGLTGTPIVMTLASRPVLAQVRCTTPSGFVSLNASHPGSEMCGGRSPATWNALDHNTWPESQGTQFTALFPTGSLYSATIGHLNLNKIMDPSTSGSGVPWDLARLVVAAYFNAAPSVNLVPASILSQTKVKAIWLEVSTYGTYSIQSGVVVWSYSEVAEYIASTQLN
jgi:hypothetical protein